MSFQAAVPLSTVRVDRPARNPFHSEAFVRESVAPEPTLWTHYNKPIILAVFGGLTLCTGSVLYLLHEFEVTAVPHGMGLVCVSVGVMFIVVALVLLPIIKDKLKRQGPKTPRTVHVQHV